MRRNWSMQLGQTEDQEEIEEKRIKALSSEERLVEGIEISRLFIPEGAPKRLPGVFALVDRSTGEVSVGRWTRRRTSRRPEGDL